MEKIDVAGLRAEVNRMIPPDPIGTVTIGIKPTMFLALLDRLEYLEKIVSRVPAKSCMTCRNYPCRIMHDCYYRGEYQLWLPLGGEKEEA